MKLKVNLTFAFVLGAHFLAACAPPEPATPTVDVAGTIAVQLASEMLTQTVAAYSPTPPPSPTPNPVTDTPIPTDTATPVPAGGQTTFVVQVTGEPDPACTTGPSASSALTSYIHTPKSVVLLGVGSVPGWYVIKNPYYGSPCWLPAERVEIDPSLDISTLPVMYP